MIKSQKIFFLFSFILMLVFEYGCDSNETVFYKTVQEHYSNGAIKEEYNINSHNRIDLYYNTYYEDGTRKSSFLMKDGKKEGVGIEYYNNGKIKIINYFKNDSLNGPYYSFYETGLPKSHAQAVGDKYIGDEYLYDESGLLKEYKCRSENGNLRFIRKYKYDKNISYEDIGDLFLNFDIKKNGNNWPVNISFVDPPNTVSYIEVYVYDNNKIVDSVISSNVSSVEYNFNQESQDSIEVYIKIKDKLSEHYVVDAFVINPKN